MKKEICLIILLITTASALFGSNPEFLDAFDINISNSGYHGGFVGNVAFDTDIECRDIELEDYDLFPGDYINVSIGLKSATDIFELINTTFVYLDDCKHSYRFTKHLNLSQQKVWINDTHFEWIQPMNVTQFVWLKTDDSKIWKKFEESHSPFTNVTLIVDTTMNDTNQTLNQTGKTQTQEFSFKLPPNWEQVIVGYVFAFLFFIIGFYLLLRYKSLFITGMVWIFAAIFFLVGYLS